MTKILLMRHAKAAPAAEGMGDFDRPLEPRGRSDAARMGKLMRERWGVPERIVCSGARRTRETLQELGLDGAIVRFDDALYHGVAKSYIEALALVDAASVLVIGHNPTVHDAALKLAASGGAELQGLLAAGFPTASVAVLDHDGPLGNLREGACRLEAFLRPSDAARA